MANFPRALVILIALWVGLLETADKLPQLLLAYPQYQANLAEYEAKMLQPELVQAQLDKAKLEATAALFMPKKSAAETIISQVNAEYAKSIGKYP